MYPCTGDRTRGDSPSPQDSQWRMFGFPPRSVPEVEVHCGKQQIMGTIGLPAVALTSGKWYYEIEILQQCTDPQFGWARRGFEPALGMTEYGWICGEDAFSYAYDGSNGRYLHGNQIHSGKGWSWSVGDVVGCLLDLDGREIRFSVAGVYTRFAFDSISVDSPWQPVLSMIDGLVDINLGDRELHFLPEGYTPVFEAFVGQTLATVKATKRAYAERANETVTQMNWELMQLKMRTNHLEEELATKLQNPDSSGALYVLELLDKLDEAARGGVEAAAPEHPGASGPESGSSTSGWRHASVEDYGRAMRIALEELAESDRREIENIRQELASKLETLALGRAELEKFLVEREKRDTYHQETCAEIASAPAKRHNTVLRPS